MALSASGLRSESVAGHGLLASNNGGFFPTPFAQEEPTMPTLERHDDVFVLDLGEGENRFHPDWIAEVEDALEQVENAEGPRALVTAATGKFYSNGLDLDWLMA